MRSDPELLSHAQPQDYHLHYALEHAPFGIESDTALFVLSAGHEQALDKLYRGLLGRKSFLLITGAPGTGKTLMLQTLLNLAAEHCEFLPIHPEDLDPNEANTNQLSELVLASAMAHRRRTKKQTAKQSIVTAKGPAATAAPAKSPPLAITSKGSSTHKNAVLRHYIETAQAENRHPVVVIDEAQRLNNAALETLRCWSNMDSHKGRAVQFILAAQPSLDLRLKTPTLASVKQRIGMRCELPALSLTDTQRYIVHRCVLAGANRPLFEQAVIARIFSLSQGYPRLINSIADALLLQTYLRGGRTVNVSDVAVVSRDLDLDYAPIVSRPHSQKNST